VFSFSGSIMAQQGVLDTTLTQMMMGLGDGF
jgi:hypothetical protein